MIKNFFCKIEYFLAKLIKKIHLRAAINSSVDKTARIEAGCHMVNSELGRFSYCGYDCTFINTKVGAFSSIANNVIVGASSHPTSWVGMSPVFYDAKINIKEKFSFHHYDYAKRTIIGNDVWIGQCVIIKQGVIVGNGAVIGMGSVVTKNIEPYTIVGGNPARVIRKRFSEDIIEKLLAIKWWTYSDEELKKYAVFFDDPVKFIDEVSRK